VRRLMTTALIAIACLTGPFAWAETVKPAVESPTAKKTATPPAKKATPPAKKAAPPAKKAAPTAKKATATAKKPGTGSASQKHVASQAPKKAKASGSEQKAKAPPARPPVNRAVSGEVTLV
jgi:hypothetical protein